MSEETVTKEIYLIVGEIFEVEHREIKINNFVGIHGLVEFQRKERSQWFFDRATHYHLKAYDSDLGEKNQVCGYCGKWF